MTGEAYPFSVVLINEGKYEMYYVIYVGSGKEKKAEDFITRDISSDICRECFHPVKHLRKRFHGEWIDIYERLIPGYVFIESDNPEELYHCLKRIPILTKLLGREMNDEEMIVYALKDEEVRWLARLMPSFEKNNQEYLIELSKVGFNENDEVIILDGPLKDMTGYVRKINLHKRIAEIEVSFFGQTSVLYLGIDLIKKDSN